jgi:drug/metabolite transporter (DMT)-like permease
MTLLNKTLAQGFDFPWTVLFIQNVGTVLIGYAYSFCRGDRLASKTSSDGADKQVAHRRLFGMKVPLAFKNKMWIVAQVVFFMATLFISLKALKFISVPLYVVARNTVPAQTALLERIFSGTRITLVAVVGLCFTIVGAVVYTYGDLGARLNLVGLAYAVVLTLVVAGCSVIDKTSVRVLGHEEDITPAEVNQIRVAVSLPVNIIFMGLLEVPDFQAGLDLPAHSEKSADIFQASATMSYAVSMSLILSTIFGYGMGTFNFYLQQSVNAASVQVANILYKLLTTILSRVTHPAPVTSSSWAGFAISLAGIALYTFGPRLMPPGNDCPCTPKSDKS